MKLRTLDVSYAQLAVFRRGLAEPLNDWTDAYLAQGFAWRDGSVSFATLDPNGRMEVEVLLASAQPTESAASRILCVPFSIEEEGGVEVASVSDGVPVSVPAGEYRLTFEHGRRAGREMWCRLSFEAVGAPVQPEIVRADDLLNPAQPLLMGASPAR